MPYFKDNQGEGYNTRVYFTKDRKYYDVTYQSGLDPYWADDTKEEQAFKV